MKSGFVFTVFDTKTQQYQKRRYKTVELARAAADRLNAKTEKSRYIVHPVSVS